MGASNRELKTDIETLSAELGLSMPEGLERMNNPRLVEALEALQARKAGGAPGGTEAGAAAGPAPADDAPVTPEATGAVTTPPEDAAPPGGSQLDPVEPTPDGITASVATPQPAAPQRYYVASGKTVVANKGKIGALQQVKAKDVAGGVDELESLVKAGFLVKSDRLLS